MSTPHITTATVSNTSYVPLVKFSGDAGTLNAVGVAGGHEYHYVRVSIDGVLVVDDFLVGSNNSFADSNGSLAVLLPFDNDLEVEVRDDPNASSLTKFWAAYVTDHSEPAGEPTVSIREVDGIEYAYRETTWMHSDGSYVIQELVGPTHRASIELDRDVVRGDEPLAGRVVLQPRRDELEPIAVVIRPSRFRTPVQVHDLTDEAARDSEFSIPIDPRLFGYFTIATDLVGYANEPTTFLRLP